MIAAAVTAASMSGAESTFILFIRMGAFSPEMGSLVIISSRDPGWRRGNYLFILTWNLLYLVAFFIC